MLTHQKKKTVQFLCCSTGLRPVGNQSIDELIPVSSDVSTTKIFFKYCTCKIINIGLWFWQITEVDDTVLFPDYPSKYFWMTLSCISENSFD